MGLFWVEASPGVVCLGSEVSQKPAHQDSSSVAGHGQHIKGGSGVGHRWRIGGCKWGSACREVDRGH